MTNTTLSDDSNANADIERSKVLDTVWLTWRQQITAQESDPNWQKNNLEWDLRSTDWIVTKTRNHTSYAQNLYAALCNNQFQRNTVWERLKGQFWSCSWRHAGSVVAQMREQGDYMDWYCSGILENFDDGSVAEGIVTDEIKQDLFCLGWLVVVDK